MTIRNRYAVPLEELDQVQVDAERQVTTQSAGGAPPDAGTWGGALATTSRDGTAHGGGGGDADGE